MSEQEVSGGETETALDDPQAPVDGIQSSSAQARPSKMLMIKRVAGRYRARWRSIVVAALVVATVGVAAGMYFVQYRPDRQIDDAAAQQAIRAASDGAVAVLSYSSDNLDRDFANAKSHLTGDFLAYYNKFSQEVVAPAVQQKHLTQKAAVIRAGVSELHPDSARVLVFVNQTVTNPDKKDPLMTPSIVRVTLAKVNGSWLISKLDPVE
jgi:Mce-associated membrane protein